MLRRATARSYTCHQGQAVTRKLSRAVRSAFRAGLTLRLPQFVSYKPRHPVFDDHLYRCAVAPDLFFYLVLSMHNMNDTFTIDVAWAEVDEWIPHCMGFRSHDAPDKGIVHFRQGDLFEDRRIDLWWEFARTRTGSPDAEILTLTRKTAPLDFYFEGERVIEDIDEDALALFIENALKLVQTTVDDAFTLILNYAIPYFKEIAKARGYADRWAHAMRDQA